MERTVTQREPEEGSTPPWQRGRLARNCSDRGRPLRKIIASPPAGEAGLVQAGSGEHPVLELSLVDCVSNQLSKIPTV